LSKIVIVGAGFVGATAAYTFMLGGTAREIVLIDKIIEKARGEAMDLSHGAAFVSPVKLYAGDYGDCRDADIVIITAGASQLPGQSRLELVEKNSLIIKETVSNILEYNTDTILVIVTNPVDVMSYVAWRASGFTASRVIGSGTVLDTSRFRHLLSAHCGIDPRNIHAYVIGEHGDSEVLLWSAVNIAGIPLNKYCSNCTRACSHKAREEISCKVRRAAYEIIEGKGATYYAISLALRRIAESILRNEHSILTVSTLIKGIYGVTDLYLSLPCSLGRKGVEDVIPFELDTNEKNQFLRSAKIVKDYIPLALNHPCKLL